MLKEGAMIILLRNLNAILGLVNGTRLMVTGLKDHVLGCLIASGALLDASGITSTRIHPEPNARSGPRAGQMVFIPRMDCSPSDNRSVQLFFTLIRKQFPVRLAFCMTINKAQGQTIKGRLGIYLPSPVFSHGQLYVAMSRSGAEHTVRGVVIDHAPLAPNNRASAETPDQRTARQEDQSNPSVDAAQVTDCCCWRHHLPPVVTYYLGSACWLSLPDFNFAPLLQVTANVVYKDVLQLVRHSYTRQLTVS